MSTQYTVEVFEAFDMNIFDPNSKPSAPYWRGAIQRLPGGRTVARTDRHETREAAEREAAELLKQFAPRTPA